MGCNNPRRSSSLAHCYACGIYSDDRRSYNACSNDAINAPNRFSEIIALAGLGLYLVVGVIGSGLTAQFYHHFEVRAGKPYKGRVTNALTWMHLVLMNIGVAATSILMIYARYLGDMAVTEKEVGGFGMTIEQASQQILNPFIAPVSFLLLITVIGAVTGGVGFIINQFKRREIKPRM
jgi:hypothetical protein